MPQPDRYHRQSLLPGIGPAGQQALQSAHALLVGCGALGSAIADSLVRAGIGTLTIVDRDIVELTNLQRQTLYSESDLNTPKAFAAQSRLAAVNSSVRIIALCEDFNPSNAREILNNHFAPSDDPPPPPIALILDGLDNFPTRYLLNDLAVWRSIPYIYGGAVASTGLSFTILPRFDSTRSSAASVTSPPLYSADLATSCLRCVFPHAPPPGASPTCDTAGVLGPIISMIAAHQSAQAIKLLTANAAQLDRSLLSIDLWTNVFHRLDLSASASPACPCCALRNFEFLDSRNQTHSSSLCGRNSVQVLPSASSPASAAPGSGSNIDLHRLAGRLAHHGSFSVNALLLRGQFSAERGHDNAPIQLTIFPTGRALFQNLSDPARASSLYAKYIGL